VDGGGDGGRVSIGSDLTAARERAGLTVEQLSAETRIRPGLITAMENDDFTRCGGNFYARGHIRAIARAVKADPAPLLARFDETQTTPEILDRSRQDERAVAKPPTLHPTRPRWAAVAGAILIGLIGWGMVRLFSLPGDVEATPTRSTPTNAVTTEVAKPSPIKPTTASVKPTPPGARKLTLTLTVSGQGSYVTLRNYHGVRLFQGMLGPNSSHTLTYAGSIRVNLGVARNVRVFVNGKRVSPDSGRFMVTVTGAIDKTV
jgi:cytoskeleton protein RodZ